LVTNQSIWNYLGSSTKDLQQWPLCSLCSFFRIIRYHRRDVYGHNSKPIRNWFVSIIECVRRLTWSVFGRYIWWGKGSPYNYFSIFNFLLSVKSSNHTWSHDSYNASLCSAPITAKPCEPIWIKICRGYPLNFDKYFISKFVGDTLWTFFKLINK
jgi:hypothetical protein